MPSVQRKDDGEDDDEEFRRWYRSFDRRLFRWAGVPFSRIIPKRRTNYVVATFVLYDILAVPASSEDGEAEEEV